MTFVAGALRGPTIAEALSRPANNFAITRLALSLAVVVSHAFSVTTGVVLDEPLVRRTGFSLGEHAVNGFFAVSGFLVAMSFARRGWRDYVVARTLRIVPGFVAATFVVSFGIGTAMTRLSPTEYLADSRLWRFVMGTLTTFKSNAALPEVFAQNPFAFPMGTVWTLKYEVVCYVALLIAGSAGLLRRKAALAFVGLFAAALVIASWRLDPLSKGLETALRLPFIFALGSALYLWRDRVRVSFVSAAALLAGALLAQSTFPYRMLLFAAEAYAIIAFSLSPFMARPVLERRGDLSYGVYLYGWPVQQALRQLVPNGTVVGLLLPSLGLTLALAALSWWLVEKPALRLKARLLGSKRPTLPASP